MHEMTVADEVAEVAVAAVAAEVVVEEEVAEVAAAAALTCKPSYRYILQAGPGPGRAS